MPGYSYSDPKLPRARSSRRRSSDNAWTAQDSAQRRAVLVVLVLVAIGVAIGCVLIVRGLSN